MGGCQTPITMKKSVQNQLNSLNKELATLFRDLKKYSDDDLNWKPSEGKWSVLQIMEHLILAEYHSQRYVYKKINYDDNLVKAGVMSSVRSSLISSYLKLPFSIKAPAAVGTETLAETATFWELVKQWKQQREDLETFLNSLDSSAFKMQAYKHPRGGRMSIGHMLNFYKSHFRRHRKQIDKILKNFRY